MARPWDGDTTVRDRPEESRIDAMVVEARALGDAWLADDCSFCDVTLGMGALSRRLQAMERPRSPGPPLGRVLVTPMPGDQHSFGSQLVGMVLRQAGWDVTADIDAEEDALCDALSIDRHVALCLSIGHDRALDRAPRLVRALRKASRGDLVVAVGGPMLNGRPDRARAIGADLHVEDARDLSTALAPHAMALA